MTKVAFFGTSNRSVPVLESLKQNFDLVLCVTKEDVLVGRHQTPKETEVKRWAKENGVNFVTLDKIEQIKLLGAEIGVVADFGFIIPKEVLGLFPRGLINIHFSLLPKYRGASPVQFAILNGDTITGITYQLMEQKLDTGPIIDQITYPLNGSETAGELYQTLFKLSAEHLPVVLQRFLKGNLKPKPQDESQVSYAPKIHKENAKIEWGSSAQHIYAAIRAYNPWPIAWTTLGEMQGAKDKIIGFGKIKDPKNASKVVKIYEAKITDSKIAAEKVQMEGGKILSWEQFKNGYLA